MLLSYDKALELNLDPQIYGTFAEIGAGQDTANWFFRASGTAGLVAKSISAYDMVMSDAIYGHADRYVSAKRLGSMLDHEYDLLLDRLSPQRGDSTTFFSFCNTVRARGYKDSGACHGWMGIRFQLNPGDPPSEIILHVHLLDSRSLEQMEALGILGLNLIHAAFRKQGDLKGFVDSLSDNLGSDRIEVDLLKFVGHGFEDFDNRLCALQLVQSGLTSATMFMPNGEVVQPAEALYKRPVLLLRGSFNPVLNLHLLMLDQAREGFCESLSDKDKGLVVELCEISMSNLLRESHMDASDFIGRADALQALGKTVLVSSCAEFHRISAFLNRSTTKRVGIILSIGLLNELFKAKWSANLAGGVLESFGRLFKSALTLHVFPWKNRKSGEIVTAQSFMAPEDSLHLYQHFLENGSIRSIECADNPLMLSTSRDVNAMILNGNEEWKKLVPKEAWDMAARLAE